MRRSTMLYAVIGGILAVVAGGIGVYLLVRPSSASSSSSSLSSASTWLSVGVSVVTAIVGSIAVIIEPVRSWWSRYRRRRLEARIAYAEVAEIKVAAAADVGEMAQEDRRYFGLDAEDRRLVRYRAERDEAEKELGPYLPANPRQAKRIVNHGRLYALIAEDRGAFGGNPELTHRHLAKWVLILEHWPRLGAALTRDPTKMQELEACLTVEALGQAIDTIISGARATDELFQFLRGGVTLSPVLDRLVRFEPSAVADDL